MSLEVSALAFAAASVAVVHALLGPDHYVPFAAMAAARGWSTARTLSVTALCGAAHVASSVALGAAGIAFGASLERLLGLEAWRGDVAAWLLLGFGIAWTLYGVREVARARPHHHEHVHADGLRHAHAHDHRGAHAHVHAEGSPDAVAPWALFAIFLLGPCEPMIPLLMYPAARGAWAATAAVAVVFAAVTIATMLAAVWIARRGLQLLPRAALASWSHAAAGAAISACALAMLLLGL